MMHDHSLPCPVIADSPTGFSHPRCYASALNDCVPKITKEHYITHSVLKLLGGGPAPRVSGLPVMQAGETKPLANTSFANRMLRRRHNGDGLSGLDDRGKKLFESTARINEEFSTDTALNSERFLFHGPDIERWILKILCGLLYSSQATTSAGTLIEKWKLPETWLKILFGQSVFPTGWGLYYPRSIVGTAGELGVGFAVVSADSDPYAFIANVNGLPFLLSMTVPPQDLRGTLLEGAIYRPRCLSISDGRIEKIIDFGWSDGHIVNMEYTRTPPSGG